MNFPALLVIFVLITGFIWLLDSLFWAPKRGKEQKEPVIVDYARSFFPIILVVLLVRSFVAEPFRIPSSSMLPTLHVGDFILVNKFSYGLRLPVLNNKVIAIGEPERGDVVVFRYPENPKVDYIKRVIGLPGDRVGYFNKTITINGKEIAQDVRQKGESLSGLTPASSELRYEHLGDKGHDILFDPRRKSVEGEVIVPEGEYFVMGDNRDNSRDSRYWGFLPEQNLVGKAFFIWMSWDWKHGGIVWDRIGDSID